MSTLLVLPPTAASFLRVAGLPILLRAVLAGQRAGFARIVIADGPHTQRVQALFDADPRTRAVEIGRACSSDDDERVVVVPADCVVTQATFERLADAQLDGTPLQFAGTGAGVALIRAADLRASGLYETAADVGPALDAFLNAKGARRSTPGDGVFCWRVADEAQVKAAETALAEQLRQERAATDGPLARLLDRRISTPISRWLVRHTEFTPNQVTVLATAVGLLGAVFLGAGTYWTGLAGTLLFLFSTMVDGCDGEVARLRFQDSDAGRRFDILNDNIVHAAIFVGLGIGLYRRDAEAPFGWLLALLLGGFAVNGLVAYRYLPGIEALTRVPCDPTVTRHRKRRWLLRAIEAVMGRDFAYLLVLFAVVDRLAWFVWGAAVGSYAFAALVVVAYWWIVIPAAEEVPERPQRAASEPEPIGAGAVAGRPSGPLRNIERLLLAAGIGLFVFLVYQLGAASVLANLRLVGWGILLIIAQESLAITANTFGWFFAFPEPRPRIPFRRFVAARIAGDGVNYTTPTATLGGEFVRTRLLRDAAPMTSLVASVAVAKLTQAVGQIGFIVVGLLLVLDEAPLPPGVRRGMLIGLALFSAAAAALIWAQRRGMFAPLLRAAHRLGLPERGPHLLRSFERLDAEIARFHGKSSRAFVRSAGCFFVGWTCGVLEMYLILWFLDVGASVERALTIEVLSAAIDGLLFFVPVKAGTQEGGKVLIFTVLGLGPAKGLAAGIVRRIRELTWAFIGLIILWRQQGSLRALSAASSSPPSGALSR